MALDPKAAEFRHLADDRGIVLRTADDQEPRFVFDLKGGTIVTTRHLAFVRQLLPLAESFYGVNRGEARELSRLISKREPLEAGSATVIIWQSATRAHATSPDRYVPSEWAQFGAWIRDQFLLEALSTFEVRNGR